MQVARVEQSADEVVEWINSNLIVPPQSPLGGQPFILDEWQEGFIRGAMPVAQAGATTGRGNGKTPLVASFATCILHPDAPLYLPRKQDINLTAPTMTQAKILFDYIVWFMDELVGDDHIDRSKWRKQDNRQFLQLMEVKTNSILRVLSSDSKGAHGFSGVLNVIDEPAQMKANSGASLYAAMRTTRGKDWNTRLWIIGTMADSHDHWFNRVINSPSKRMYVQKHAAPKKADIEDEDALRLANPMYDKWPWLREIILEEQEDALNLGGAEKASFEALRMNKGVSDTTAQEMMIASEDWELCEVDILPTRRGPVFVALDLGGEKSMCAAAFYWPQTGRLEVIGAFPNRPPLKARSAADNVPGRYEMMLDRGEIKLFPGIKTPLGPFLRWVKKFVEGQEVLKVRCDRFRQGDLEQELLNESITWPMEWRRMTAEEGSTDLRYFRREVLDMHLKYKYSLLVDSALEDTIIRTDSKQNPYVDKSDRHTDRIDAAQAMILAVSAGRHWRLPEVDDDDNKLKRFYESAADQGLIDKVGGVA